MSSEPGRSSQAMSTKMQIILIVVFATILAVLAFAAASIVLV